MFRFYDSYDLISELEKELLRDHKIVQLMIDEYDLFVISKALFESISNGLTAELVIISTSHKKSMKLVNLCKRLIDMNVEIYWKVDKDLFVKEDYYAIFDKEYLLSKHKQEEFESPEGLVRFKNDFFNGLALASKKLTMFDGDMYIDFEIDHSIIYPNEEVVLSWDVQNAHEIEIEPLKEKINERGTKNITIEEDTKFTLIAKNKGNIQKKSVFVRVLKIKEIAFDIEVFDPLIKQCITIKPSSNKSGSYAVYFGQKVKISWDIKMLGKLLEAQLGNLPLLGSHEFEIIKKTDFNFVFKSLNNTQRKSISLHCFEDPKIYKEHVNDIKIKSIKNRNFLKKFLYLSTVFFTKFFK